jgi:SAM-dependent methyltransferase
VSGSVAEPQPGPSGDPGATSAGPGGETRERTVAPDAAPVSPPAGALPAAVSPDSATEPAAHGGRWTLPSAASERASRRWWDSDAAAYMDRHGDFLGDAEFVWCPEALHEDDARLLGDVAGRRVLEIGCGAAMCSRWLAAHGAHPVGLDLSAGMLAQAVAGAARTGIAVPLVRAGAERLPFAAGSAAVMREVARVLRPGGRWVFATNHPVRWAFPDDPGPAGLVASIPYFDRTGYVETDPDGTPSYVEHHRTLGDRVREIAAAGLLLTDLVEPEWPDGHEREWGQWSPLRGAILPGTAIYVCTKPA